MKQDEIMQIFPGTMRKQWQRVMKYADKMQEIRIRADKPVAVWIDGREAFVSDSGELIQTAESGLCYTGRELEQILEQICQFSLYAFSDEIKRGYLTIPGGHRVGLAGQMILEKDGSVRNMKYIRCMNVRIAHEIRGVSDPLLPELYRQGKLLNTLILSPPGCGKTTMLRDLIRNVSNGNAFGEGQNVSVVDERSELGGSYMGVAQNDLGIRTDLLDACPKIDGMMLLIRSMAPDVLAVDELGSVEEINALQLASGCGCRLLATIHGSTMEEILAKKYMEPLFREKTFERYIILTRRDKKCVVEGIYDKEGRKC